MKKWFFLSLVLLLSLPGQASARRGQPGRWHTSFEIGPDGDTISVVPIKPVFVFSKKADLRRYRKLVEVVKKVYPVAQAAKAQMVQMEAELLRLETKKEQKQQGLPDVLLHLDQDYSTTFLMLLPAPSLCR